LRGKALPRVAVGQRLMGRWRQAEDPDRTLEPCVIVFQYITLESAKKEHNHLMDL
jgi:hypothetical protein